MALDAAAVEALGPKLAEAQRAMAALEAGAIANPDENRMVGHYWLRAPQLAPTAELAKEIADTLAAIKAFAAEVHAGKILGSTGKKFSQLLVIGIGGSALGPQFVNHALGQPATDKLAVSFFDNTDPDGIDYVLASLAGKLPETLAVVISKSGGTAETRNGQLEAAAAFCPDVELCTIDDTSSLTRDEIVSAADVFLSLSDNIQETFGLTPLEAMAAGLPCLVSTACGCAVDLIEHNRTGWCFDTKRTLALTELMHTAERQLPDKRATMVASAKQRLEAFTPQAFAQGLLAAKDQAIHQPRFSRRAALTADLLSRLT